MGCGLWEVSASRNPQALWVSLQLLQTWEQPQRFLLFDRACKCSADVVATVKVLGCRPVRSTFRSPWQNGVAEPWVSSVRRDLLDQVIPLKERHPRRLLREYVSCYHQERTHLGLAKDTPTGRVPTPTPGKGRKVISRPRIGGLHHRYAVAA